VGLRTTSDARPSSDRVIVIVGPTGVGKSALAEELAVSLCGEIVSADSMQVYRGMDVGTAKTPSSERRVPHHCLDLVDPGTAYSAALFQSDARRAIDSCHTRGVMPVVCGGTGLYVRAAIDDFSFAPGEREHNQAREIYEDAARVMGGPHLHTLLAERDPESAAMIHPNNVRRVVRALELSDQGVRYADLSRNFGLRVSVYDALWIGLSMDRSHLYGRIDDRVERMVERGLVAEVEHLLSCGLRTALTAQQAIGYKEIVRHIDGQETLDEAVEAIKRHTRRYAKRQLTWFRADPRVTWLDVTDATPDEQVRSALEALHSTDIDQ
jgi:tRNA dimethylallyltransferase